MKKILPIIMLLFLSSCRTHNVTDHFGSANQKAVSVSLINLIATPEKYHGKLVRVDGFLRIEFEGNELLLSKDDYHHRISKNGVWISPDCRALNTTPQKLELLNGKHVLVEGIFDREMTGHMGLNSGSLQNVTRIMAWND